MERRTLSIHPLSRFHISRLCPALTLIMFAPALCLRAMQVLLEWVHDRCTSKHTSFIFLLEPLRLDAGICLDVHLPTMASANVLLLPKQSTGTYKGQIAEQSTLLRVCCGRIMSMQDFAEWASVSNALVFMSTAGGIVRSGQLQSLLSALNVAYTGSPTIEMQICNDKVGWACMLWRCAANVLITASVGGGGCERKLTQLCSTCEECICAPKVASELY